MGRDGGRSGKKEGKCGMPLICRWVTKVFVPNHNIIGLKNALVANMEREFAEPYLLRPQALTIQSRVLPFGTDSQPLPRSVDSEVEERADAQRESDAFTEDRMDTLTMSECCAAPSRPGPIIRNYGIIGASLSEPHIINLSFLSSAHHYVPPSVNSGVRADAQGELRDLEDQMDTLTMGT